MITSEEMKKYAECDVTKCNKQELTDIRSIEIHGGTASDRALDLIEKMNNPYMFVVGDVVVKVNYSGNDKFSKMLTDAICMS